MYLTENLQEKWQLKYWSIQIFQRLKMHTKETVTTVILENQEKAVREDRCTL